MKYKITIFLYTILHLMLGVGAIESIIQRNYVVVFWALICMGLSFWVLNTYEEDDYNDN